MLLNYSFKNFCSFKNNVLFSLQATENIKDIFLENFVSGIVDILKSAVIIGENAGGKSNFVKSLLYFKSFFQDNQKLYAKLNYINDDYNLNHLHLIDTLQEFSITVLINDVIYSYNLSLDFLGLNQENLTILEIDPLKKFKNNEFFSVKRINTNCNYLNAININQNNHELENISKNIEYKFETNDEINYLKPTLQNMSLSHEKMHGLFLSKLALLGVAPAINLSDWINNSLCVESMPYDNYEWKKNNFKNDDDLNIMRDNKFVSILQMIDPSIYRIKINPKSPFLETIIYRKNEKGDIFKRELMDDSSGLRDYFAWAIQIFKVVYQNKVVFADEMDRSLNPILADKIISFIHGSEHSGQFIFTTHNVLHLNLNNFMKEQIYFITKDLSTLHSDLYSLADFSDINYNSDINIYEFYLRGILGGTIRG